MIHERSTFYDLLVVKAFKQKDKVPQDVKEQLKCSKGYCCSYKSTIKIVDFWHKGYEQESLKSEIDDMLLFSNIDEIIEVKEQITCDFMELAKRKHNEMER